MSVSDALHPLSTLADRYHMRRAMKELHLALQGRFGYMITNKILGHAEALMDADMQTPLGTPRATMPTGRL